MQPYVRISEVAWDTRSCKCHLETRGRAISPFFPRSNFLRDGNKSLITSEVRRCACGEISISVLICHHNTSSAWRHLDSYVFACLCARGTCVPPLLAKAESPGFRFFSLYKDRDGRHGSFVKWNTCANSTYMGRMREFIYIWEDRDKEGETRYTTAASLLAPKTIPTYASVHYSHDYGGSCLLLVKFRLLYAA